MRYLDAIHLIRDLDQYCPMRGVPYNFGCSIHTPKKVEPK